MRSVRDDPGRPTFRYLERLRVNHPPELLSPRLRLRGLRRADAAALCAYRSLPDVARYQSWASFGPNDAAALIASQDRTPPGTPGSWLQLGLTLADSGELIGDCGIHFPQD